MATTPPLTARAPGHSNIGPQIHLDLWQANRRQLLDAGIPAKRITVIGECTACTGLGTAAGRKYFSHRAESGFTGRMLAVIGVAAAPAKVGKPTTPERWRLGGPCAVR